MSSMERSAVSAGPRASAGMERDRMRIAILDEASIVCSTLSFSGAGVFMRMNRGFDVVVIDEAAQAVEPSTLVPLAHGCRQVFLVGDPLQLPATVLSTEAVAYG
jgi:senataxin